MMSPRKEPRRRFTCKEKGKKKMLEYDFGSAESDQSESVKIQAQHRPDLCVNRVRKPVRNNELN